MITNLVRRNFPIRKTLAIIEISLRVIVHVRSTRATNICGNSSTRVSLWRSSRFVCTNIARPTSSQDDIILMDGVQPLRKTVVSRSTTRNIYYNFPWSYPLDRGHQSAESVNHVRLESCINSCNRDRKKRNGLFDLHWPTFTSGTRCSQSIAIRASVRHTALTLPLTKTCYLCAILRDTRSYGQFSRGGNTWQFIGFSTVPVHLSLIITLQKWRRCF